MTFAQGSPIRLSLTTAREKILISNSSPDPIYEQTARQLKAQIISGDLAGGQVLPSIRRLAQDLQISVNTTKRAHDELGRAGSINTVGGEGSGAAAAIDLKKMSPTEIENLKSLGYLKGP